MEIFVSRLALMKVVHLQRMDKMSPQTLPVQLRTMMIQENGMEIYYPQVVDLPSRDVEQKINEEIFAHVQQLVHDQYQKQDTQSFEQMIGTYEIKTNERNVLSLSLTNYAYAPYFAHGLTLMKSLTFDTKTGKLYALKDLFQPNSDYERVLSDIIQKQIKEREIPLLGEFPGILPDQDFYIADKSLVVYYQAYEITAGYIGLPMFPISVYALENIVIEDGPLGRMASP